MIELTRYPTTAEMDAMAAAARQARARAFAGLIAAAARGLKTLAARCGAALTPVSRDTDSPLRRNA
ncbi:hypothetical protein D3C83_137340 [compost metagenome]